MTVRPLRGGLAGDGAGDAGGLATGPEDAGQVQVPRADVLDTVRHDRQVMTGAPPAGRRDDRHEGNLGT